jgi:DNA-binding response OmpR family regulator
LLLSPRALVVENDGDVREQVCDVLRANGYRAIAVGTLAEARVLLHDTFDVLVIDLELPDGGSDELLHELAPRLSAPPTLLVSASRAAVGVARNFGVAFLSKPFDLDRLMVVLRDATPPNA